MRIAVLREPRRFTVEEVDVPVPGPDEVLVQVAACGVCASELETWASPEPGSLPRRLGHEVSGVVVERGSAVTAPAVGDRVGVWVTERGYAEYVAVKAAFCRPAGPGPLEAALAEPLACAVNALEAADVRLADDVVVVGAGFMGNLVQALAALRGVRNLVVADTRPDALERAERLGATRVVDVTREPLADAVAAVTGGQGADVTFECTGTQAGLASVDQVTRMSGTVGIVGFHQGTAREIPLAHWNWMAFRIANGHFRDLATIMRGMTVGMRLVEAGLLDLEPLVTHRFPLERIDEAFEALEGKPPEFCKAVVTAQPEE